MAAPDSATTEFMRSSAARPALQYVLLFGATGVSLPFAGLWLKAQGLTGAEIGTLLAAPMLARLVTGPMIAVWADGFARRRTPIAILGLIAAAGYAGAGLVEGYALWALCWVVAATATSGMLPLTDVLTLRVARRDGFTFSLPRGFGSAAFVAANVVMGALLARAPVDLIIVWITVASLLSAVVASVVLPAEPVGEGERLAGRERFKGLGRLAADPVFMTAIVAVGAVQSAHAVYYGFSAILWKAQGLSETLTGLLWAFAVAVEIGFMWVIEPWRRRVGIGAVTLLAIGAGAAAVRWAAMALAPPSWALWPLQTLHALSFAATFLAGVELVDRLSPAESHTAGQTLSAVLSTGVLMGLATVLSGPLYDSYGAGAYLAMSGLALFGLAATARLGRAERATA